jgi:hypothetical protein
LLATDSRENEEKKGKRNRKFGPLHETSKEAKVGSAIQRIHLQQTSKLLCVTHHLRIGELRLFFSISSPWCTFYISFLLQAAMQLFIFSVFRQREGDISRRSAPNASRPKGT